jgi:hypothetical protein
MLASMEPKDDGLDMLRKRLVAAEAVVAAQEDEAGTASRLAGASNEQAVVLVNWVVEFCSPGPILEEQLCRLLDRDYEPLSIAIFRALEIGEDNTELLRRAIASLDSPSIDVRASAISSLPDNDEALATRLEMKITALATDPQPCVRLSIAYQFGLVRPLLLLPMLEDEDGEVRYGACEMLGQLPQYSRLAETVARRLVLDGGARPTIREMAADILRTEDERRAAHELLAREGICKAPEPGDRFFSATSRPEHDEKN